MINIQNLVQQTSDEKDLGIIIDDLMKFMCTQFVTSKENCTLGLEKKSSQRN